MEQNPYESPRSESLPFTPLAPNHPDLEQRVAELERLVSRSYFLRPNLLSPTFAVWGYWFLGYLAMGAIFWPIFLLLDWLTSRRW